MSETIAAIATAMSDAGIGIVRISGFEAFEIVDRVFRNVSKKNLSQVESHTIQYGFIMENENIIDEVLVMVMKGPRSYTGEDTVEINCHGGIFVVKKVLEAVIRSGARIAEPGEFSKRAFLNGRMDLSSAEAVIDVIHSRNEYALHNSVKQLKGAVSDGVKMAREKILYEIAFIESALDDPEHVSIDGYSEKLSKVVQEIRREIEQLIQTADNGRLIQEGIKTVIAGKPNVGKSSLMNALVGEEKAIVTDIAGTTRDVLEENIYLSGINLRILDTAGIRETKDAVEKIGVARAKEHLLDADLVIYVVDSSVELDESDFDIIRYIKDKKTVILLNKTDKNMLVSADEIKNYTSKKVILTSLKERLGLQELENEIKMMFFGGELEINDEVVITNVRHKAALEEAYESLGMVENSIHISMPEDFYSIDLMNAYETLGRIIGESVGEDLVNEIFSKFCMGK